MKVHQALHGYNQGHNLLYSSINLPYEDEDYMIDRYSNKYNVDLNNKIFIVLYEYFDFNEIGDYVAEIYPLI